MARSAVVRLAGRGIFAIEVDGILARLTQAQSAGTDESIAKLKNVLAVATALANSIRSRVRDRGQLASVQFAQFDTAKTYRVSKEYSSIAGAGGQMKFKSSADFHGDIGATAGTFKASGRMWEGLQVRGFDANSAIIDFAGISEGSGKPAKIPATHRKFLVKTMLSERVRNAAKAGRILSVKGIHVLEPADAETTAVQGAYALALRRIVLGAFDGDSPSGSARGDLPLYSALQNAMA